MLLEGLLDFILVDEQLDVHVLVYLPPCSAAVNSDVDDAERLKTLEDLSEGVGREMHLPLQSCLLQVLIIRVMREGLRALSGGNGYNACLQEVQLSQHVVASVL